MQLILTSNPLVPAPYELAVSALMFILCIIPVVLLVALVRHGKKKTESTSLAVDHGRHSVS
ncbi:hypothetical protein J2S35_000865 [Falsarthrobacter nasiphocae]|uniref:Uncharacterized protein n=1 Tax=Falsarthrobacter nasiphocae TaxID=189863 RepID=A0AAE4C808_9MICC|nr:hypothetical protein [Falsarthrobacter nasiphocae]